MSIQVLINGKSFEVDPVRTPVDTSLNSFIRSEAHLSGAKSMCNEGGCGACIVAIQSVHPVSKESRIWAVNSCLTPIYACEGYNVITVEGIGDKANGYHIAQSRLAQLNGTQCGYCSPGMVMNMYSLLEASNGQVTMADVENSFGGNICRCTGYRPILDAFKSLAIDADEKYKLCADIEDFPTKKCPKTGNECSGSCKVKNGLPKSIHLSVGGRREWHKVYDLSEISQILANASGKKYMLVAGNTAHGVYRRATDIQIFIDINGVDQLRSHNIESQIEVGGGVKLTEFMEILKSAEKADPMFSYCKELHAHVDLIANVPVRNAGSIAGNLMIKHGNPDFPSDIFVILAAVNATLSIVESGGKISNVSLVDFLKLNMENKIILKVNLPRIDDSKFKLKTFKIMKRAQNTHAYVNAAFLIGFEEGDPSTVQSANLCFGGINESFTHAKKTEQILIGRKLFSNETLSLAFQTLDNDLNKLTWTLPDADPKYRKNLAISLLYKAILQLAPAEILQSSVKSGGEILHRPISSGTQQFDTYEEDYPVTKAMPKFEGYIQTSGEAKYANDLPSIPGEVWGVFVPATDVGSKIKCIDATKALQLPGVRGFFSAKDIPGKNTFTPLCYKIFVEEEEEIFCNDNVYYYGQPLGVILADSVNLANQAAKLVEVEYEKTGKKVLPTIWDVLEAKADDRISKQPMSNKAEVQGENGTKTIKGRYECGGQYHFTMEPQTTVVIPSDCGLDVHSSTQWMDFVQVAIAESLNIPENEIQVIVKRLGGGYGGKISRPAIVACAAALAAHKLQRPVRMVLSLETNMDIIGKRYPCIGDYEVEISDDGKIQKLNNEFWQDFGWSVNESVVPLTAQWFLNCYENKTWSWNSWAVRTDSASNTYCRAPGILEGVSMIENIMEHIAFETGLCPVQVRLNNMPEDQPLRKMFDEFMVTSEFQARKEAIDAFNKENRWKKKGIAMVPLDYPQQFFGSFPAIVSVFHGDGSVLISHAGIEMGQGLNTKVAQVAARTLNVPVEMIKFRPSDSLISANALCSGGSSTSDAISVGVMNACQMILEQMKPVKEENPDATWKELCSACYNKDVDLQAFYVQHNNTLTNYSVHGLACAEVEIDVLTGNVQLPRVDIYEDVGASISPLMDLGQIEGAFVMGMGFFLNESLVFDKQSGELLTNRSWNYTPPGPKDIPIDFRVTFVKNSKNPVFILKSKATGEPPLAMTCVCLFALRNAIQAARKDVGVHDWLELPAPATPDQIYLKCLSNSYANFIL